MSALDKLMGKKSETSASYVSAEASSKPTTNPAAAMVLKMMGAFGLDQATVDKLGGDFASTVTWFKEALVKIHGQNVEIIAKQDEILTLLKGQKDALSPDVRDDL